MMDEKEKQEKIEALHTQIKEAEQKLAEVKETLGDCILRRCEGANVKTIQEISSEAREAFFSDELKNEIMQHIVEAKEQEELITKYQQGILKIEQEGFCPNCKAPVDEDDVFCRKCGYNLRDDVEEETQNCPNCGEKLPLDAVFCIKCGTRLGDVEPVWTPPTAPKVEEQQAAAFTAPNFITPEEEPEPVEPSVVEERVCKSCGNKLLPGYRFCDVCGAEVRD